ncbi:MAG: hypothetical protein BJ554DRAFT_1981 [Olpidium bornovanus]|uniref:Uncharacterized protein n=1 Tax=Olpidium bornovanus TaxID=278681 RepID=A0A8H8DH09_9FUNG|nr:MAG: hypothetical protein BJ554DRAFT_1981 [Olpidium bornovanus]
MQNLRGGGGGKRLVSRRQRKQRWGKRADGVQHDLPDHHIYGGHRPLSRFVSGLPVLTVQSGERRADNKTKRSQSGASFSGFLPAAATTIQSSSYLRTFERARIFLRLRFRRLCRFFLHFARIFPEEKETAASVERTPAWKHGKRDRVANPARPQGQTRGSARNVQALGSPQRGLTLAARARTALGGEGAGRGGGGRWLECFLFTFFFSFGKGLGCGGRSPPGPQKDKSPVFAAGDQPPLPSPPTRSPPPRSLTDKRAPNAEIHGSCEGIRKGKILHWSSQRFDSTESRLIYTTDLSRFYKGKKRGVDSRRSKAPVAPASPPCAPVRPPPLFPQPPPPPPPPALPLPRRALSLPH